MTKDRLSWIIGGLDWEKLTDFEDSFVESCEKYFKKHGDLTEKQENLLERIFEASGSEEPLARREKSR